MEPMDNVRRANNAMAGEGDESVTQEQLNRWFNALHRLARLQQDNEFATALTDSPLDRTVVELRDAGMIMVFDDNRADRQMRLLMRPEGWKVYDAFCEDLASQGRPVQGWVPGRHQ